MRDATRATKARRPAEWRKRLAKDIDDHWKALDLTYSEVEHLLRDRGVVIDRSDLWRVRKGVRGVSLEKVLWAHGALREAWEREYGTRTAKDVMRTHLYWVSSETPLGQVVDDLDHLDYSQAPVRDEHRRYIGVITDRRAARELARGVSVKRPVGEFAEDWIKVHPQTGLAKIDSLIGEGNPFVLVEKRGEVVGIISYSDLYPRGDRRASSASSPR